MTSSSTATAAARPLPIVPLAPTRDARLVSRAVSGDAAAAREIVDRHDARMYRVCRAILRDHHEAQDATQEAWVRAFRSLPRFHGDDLAAWLGTIARNEAYRAGARRAKAPLLVEALPPVADAHADPLDAAIAADIGKALMGAVRALEETYREVAVRDLAGQAPAEIAAVMQLTPGATRVRSHRARRRVQEAMRDALVA